MERTMWNDQRLDEKFDAIDRRFDNLERRMDDGFARIDARLDSIQRQMVYGFISMSAAIVASAAF